MDGAALCPANIWTITTQLQRLARPARQCPHPLPPPPKDIADANLHMSRMTTPGLIPHR